MNGWIKLHRQIADWRWFKDSNTLHVFLYLLIKANKAPVEYMGEILPAGSFVTGRKTISQDTGISEQSVRTAINRLKSTSEITIRSTNKFSIIYIVNFAKYQGCDDELNQQNNQLTNIPSTSNQPAINQQSTTKQEDKNIRSKEYINTPPIVPPKGGEDRSPSEKTQVDELVKSHTENEALRKEIRAFIEHRKKLKRPMTTHAVDLFLRHLNRECGGTDSQIEAIQKAINKGWLDVYPDKPQQQPRREDINIRGYEEFD